MHFYTRDSRLNIISNVHVEYNQLLFNIFNMFNTGNSISLLPGFVHRVKCVDWFLLCVTTGLFVLNHGTGLITAGLPLQGLAGTYHLNVGAYDTRTPSPTAQITVTILVVPTPGTQPVWIGQSTGGFSASVREVCSDCGLIVCLFNV